MPTYHCPRCNAGMEKTAAACPACGKPIAPLSWSMRLSGWGGKAPDAQVVDIAKAMAPFRLAALVLIWGIVALMGAGGRWMVESRSESIEGLRRKVQADVRVESVPVQVRDDALGLLEIQDGMLKIIDGAFAMLTGLGVLGIVAELVTFFLTRRLLAMGPDAAG